MGQWEYKVIRLNIEPPVATAPPAQPQAPPAQNPPAASQPSGGAQGKADRPQMFSEAYLKEEFPRFYDNPEAQKAAEQQAQQADPALQLQGFLNAQGDQGWELVGFQHAMPHVFIVFKRPKGAQDAVAAAQAAQGEQLRLTLDLANRALAIIEKQAG